VNNAGAWEPWSRLAAAVRENDSRGIEEIFSTFSFSFHEQRHADPERWDLAFETLILLMEHQDTRIACSARHYLWVLLGAEGGPPYIPNPARDRAHLLATRTRRLIPTFERLVHGGEEHLLTCVDNLAHVETLVHTPPQEDVVHWLEDSCPWVDGNVRRAAHLAYVVARGPWPEQRAAVFDALDDPDTLVRAVAARSIGSRYLDGTIDSKAPSFKEVVAFVTTKEIERPGIAGPLFSPWYTCDVEQFETTGGVEVAPWIEKILAHRAADEPETLPCSNGIDFFAHEIFGGQPHMIRTFLAAGQISLAIEAATEVREKIDDLEPVLMELGDHREPEVCRQASWHLAYHYRRVHPRGFDRGFVRSIPLENDEIVIFNFTGTPEYRDNPYSATLYPSIGKHWNDATAWSRLDIVLPESLRGAMTPYGLPGDDGLPGPYRIGNTSHFRFESGVLIAFDGDPDAKTWHRVEIIWKAGPGIWTVRERL